MTHCSIYARYATYVSNSRLIPHIVCNQLRPDPNNSPRLSGKYRVSSPVLFALYTTGNLIHLEDGTKLLSPTLRRRHSTPKSSSARSNLTIFAPDGILCEKIETKCGDL